MNSHKNNENLDELITGAIGRDKPQFDFDKWQKNHKSEIETFKSQTAGEKIPQPVQPLNIWRKIMKS
ncbi:MAG: hypothetical protein JW715_08795, partial [Sedimentisphaerales bacterium]|nr:hypothetical protein [Sedimentisphaerales bacterium]